MLSSSPTLGGLRRVMLIRLRKDRAIFGDDGKDTDETEEGEGEYTIDEDNEDKEKEKEGEEND